MEFLMTYGWAMLVLVVVMAILFYIGVINPKNAQTSTLFFTPGFSAYSFRVGNGTGGLELDFGQATGKSVMVTAIYCSQNSSAALQDLGNKTVIPSGEHRWVTGGNSNNTVFCTGEDGQPLSPENAQSGGRYKGKVCVRYTEMDSNIERTVCGDINARFELGGISGSPPPGGSPTPYPTPPPGAILIDTCPFQISSAGYYYLNDSLTASNTCITIDSDGSNSIVDCYGKNITSSPYSGIGIYLQGTTGVTVRHCVVSNFAYGIWADSSSSNNLIDNTATANQEGIYLSYSDDNSVSGNIANSNSDVGIAINNGVNNNVLTGNTANSNIIGVYIGGANDNTVTGNTANFNANANIYLASATGNNITDNTALASGNMGIYADGSSSNNLLTGNAVCWNMAYNVYCDAPQTDGNGNICTPYEETACYGSITCHPTCPPPPPPPCAPGWVVSSCGCVLNMPGNYTLDSDLTETHGYDCIDVATDDVKLDCRGHSVTAEAPNWGMGIMLYNWNTGSLSGVTVENCNVSGFSGGIYAQGGLSDSAIRDSNFSSNQGFGIYFTGPCDNNIISGNTASLNSGMGIQLGSGCDNTNITGNTANSNAAEGIYMYSSNNNNLTGNTAESNADCGLIVQSSSGNTLTDNTVNQNTNLGIYLSGSDGTTLTTNTACWNSDNIDCDSAQADGGGNICTPEGETVCSDSITCNSGCPAPEPPACAPDWVVSSCGCVLTVPGDYTLGSDLNYTDYGDCIDINPGASGATLDCHGHSVTGSENGQGIVINANDVTVRNCNVANFSNGIVSYTSDGSSIIGNNATLNGYGMGLYGFTNGTVRDNIVRFNSYGISLGSANDNNFTDNVVTTNTNNDFFCSESGPNNDYGNVCDTQAGCELWLSCGMPPPCSSSITDCCYINSTGTYSLGNNLTASSECISILPGASGSTLDCGGLSITGSWGGSGIHLFGTDDVSVENCDISGFSYQILLSSASGCHIVGNNVTSEGSAGIMLVYSNGNSLEGNSANLNNEGIYLEYSNSNTLRDNTVNLNYYGIYLYSSNNSVLNGNSLNSNGNVGIGIQYGSYNNTIANNTACWSGGTNANIACDDPQNDGGNNICTPEGTDRVCSNSVSCAPGCSAPLPPACAPGWVISTCGCTLLVPGSYTLDSNLSYSNQYGSCITVSQGASGSTINCQDHSITGPGFSYSGGIYLNYGASGVTVENCNVSGFEEGIYVHYADNNTLTNNIANSNRVYGIYLEDANNNILSGNTACNEPSGFGCQSSSNNTGSNRYNTQGGCGITQSGTCPPTPPVLDSCPQVIEAAGTYRLESNLTSGGGCITLAGSATSGSTIDCQGHSITGSGKGSGIWANYANGITIRNCTLSNFQEGVALSYCNSGTFSDNTVTNSQTGIGLQTSNTNIFAGNNATANSNSDFYCDGSSSNTDSGDNFCSSKDSCNWLTCH